MFSGFFRPRRPRRNPSLAILLSFTVTALSLLPTPIASRLHFLRLLSRLSRQSPPFSSSPSPFAHKDRCASLCKSRPMDLLLHTFLSFSIALPLLFSGSCSAARRLDIFTSVSLFQSRHDIFYLLVVSGEAWKPTWTKEAAEEAEVVAAIECSGHGRAYLDGLHLNGHHLPACECNPCYYGPTCSQFNSSCSANAASGDPYFLEPFWMRRKEQSAILVSGWHRMGYWYSDGSLISEMLVKYIQKLHKLVGNAETEGRFIIFGSGSTQLLNAAVYAFSPNSSLHSPAKVVATAPYYPMLVFLLDQFWT